MNHALLQRCEEAGIRLFLKHEGKTIGYHAPNGIDSALKEALKANKEELRRHLAVATDQIAVRLSEMTRNPVTGALEHPELRALPASVREWLDRGPPLVPPSRAQFIMTVSEIDRVITPLASEEGIPPDAVMYLDANGHWGSGPAHSLGTSPR